MLTGKQNEFVLLENEFISFEQSDFTAISQ